MGRFSFAGERYGRCMVISSWLTGVHYPLLYCMGLFACIPYGMHTMYVQCPEINIQYNTFHSKRSTTTLEIIILGESIQHELQRMIMKKDFEKRKKLKFLKNIQFSSDFEKCLIYIWGTQKNQRVKPCMCKEWYSMKNFGTKMSRKI